MKYLLQLWNYLDGKKTKISAAIATFVGLISAFNSVVIIGYWHMTGIPDMDPICLTLLWVAGVFGGTGLVHAYAKSQATTNVPIFKPPVAPISPVIDDPSKQS